MTPTLRLKNKATVIDNERRTIELMIRLYCRHKHGGSEPCQECRQLINYANQRLSNCPFGEHKHACRHCSVHCYGKAERERIRKVMRYAGPRMLLYHPMMALRHIITG